MEVENDALSPAELDATEVRVTASLQDGSVLHWTRVHVPVLAENPLSSKELLRRWVDCLRRSNPDLAPSEAAELYDTGLAALATPEPLTPWLTQVWDAAIWIRSKRGKQRHD